MCLVASHTRDQAKGKRNHQRKKLLERISTGDLPNEHQDLHTDCRLLLVLALEVHKTGSCKFHSWLLYVSGLFGFGIFFNVRQHFGFFFFFLSWLLFKMTVVFTYIPELP